MVKKMREALDLKIAIKSMGNCGSELEQQSLMTRWVSHVSQSQVELTLGGLDPPHYVPSTLKIKPILCCLSSKLFDKGKLSKAC